MELFRRRKHLKQKLRLLSRLTHYWFNIQLSQKLGILNNLNAQQSGQTVILLGVFTSWSTKKNSKYQLDTIVLVFCFVLKRTRNHNNQYHKQRHKIISVHRVAKPHLSHFCWQGFGGNWTEPLIINSANSSKVIAPSPLLSITLGKHTLG